MHTCHGQLPNCLKDVECIDFLPEGESQSFKCASSYQQRRETLKPLWLSGTRIDEWVLNL